MQVERANNEIKLTFSEELLDTNELQKFIDYIKFKEINVKSQASQEAADKLADEINQSWWEQNKHKFE